MEILRDFYVAVVGLQPGPRPLRSAGYWLYAGKRDVLHLSEDIDGGMRRIGSDLTFDHVAFECENWLEFKNRLERHAVAFTERCAPGGPRQVFFRDPAGNGIELAFPAGDA
ncbi:MAG TPA: VOC family protein [Azonexus sp.]|jgi:glyoxylase I family protein